MRISHPLFGAGAGGGDLRTVFLEGLVCEIAIGAYPSERGRRQKVVVNLKVLVANPASPINDDLASVLDYGTLRQGVLDLTADGHIVLQETLCEAIADFCLALPGVLSVHVSTGKLEAFADCAAVGCELIRHRRAEAPAHKQPALAWSEA